MVNPDVKAMFAEIKTCGACGKNHRRGTGFISTGFFWFNCDCHSTLMVREGWFKPITEETRMHLKVVPNETP